MGGGNEFHKRPGRQRLDDPGAHEVAPAPGKATGVPIVDTGTYCEQAPTHAGCFLDKDERTRLLVALATVVGSAMDNFRDAITNVRTDLLTTVAQSSTAWNFFAEFLFQSISGGLIGMLGKSLGALKTRIADAEGATISVAGVSLSWSMQQKIAKLDDKLVTGVAVQASKGIRTTLKNAAHQRTGTTVASAENVEAADFLKIIQAGIGPLTNNLVLEAPATMTDGEVAALVAAYQDADYHSVAAYEADLRALLDAYRAQQIASIGDGLSNGTDQMSTREAVFVVADGGRSRMAIVEYYNPAFGGPMPYKGVDGQLVPWAQPVFISWVGGSLSSAAIDYQADRVGAMKVVDATGGKTGMPQIDEWAVAP